MRIELDFLVGITKITCISFQFNMMRESVLVRENINLEKFCNRFSIPIDIWYLYNDFEFTSYIRGPCHRISFYGGTCQRVIRRYFSSIVNEKYFETNWKGCVHHFEVHLWKLRSIRVCFTFFRNKILQNSSARTVLLYFFRYENWCGSEYKWCVHWLKLCWIIYIDA